MVSYKRIPYGLTDFHRIQTDGYYYVDKTHYIPEIEKSPAFLFFIRPRRFGKSLLLAILDSYYNIARKDEFEAVFKDTYIGQHPTRERNSYLILKFNFSEVYPKIDKLEASFESHCELCLAFFNREYSKMLGDEYLEKFKNKETTCQKLEFMFYYLEETKKKLYILIDEYDNFTNSIYKTTGQSSYKALDTKEGFIPFFFDQLKNVTVKQKTNNVKMVVTGVTPLMLEGLSLDIEWNIAEQKNLNGLVGFTRSEVIEMIEYYRSKDLIKNTSEELIPIIDVWYGNYHFSRQPEEPIYNSVMVTYFILSIIPNDHIPTQLIDQNVVISYHKLKHLLIKDKKINDNFLTLKSIVDNGEICTDLLTSFSIDDLFKKDCFLSLLYSFGLLTIYGEENGLIKLVITNKTNQKFLTDFICRGYEEAEIFKINSFDFGNLVSNMAYYGEWKPVFQFLAAAINEQTSIRDFIDGENMVKGFLLAFLNSTNYYVIYPETEMNKGYADQYLEPFLIQYKEMTTSYLIELKYIPRGTKPLTKPAIRKKVNEGAAQLMQYAQDPYVQKTKANTELKKLVLVWQGWELVRMDEVK